MAGTRKYKRDSKGRFAGSAGGGGGGGTFVTVGKSGGFANQAFRARVAQGSARTGRGTATRLSRGRRARAFVGRTAKRGALAAAGNPLLITLAAGGVASAVGNARQTRKVNKGLNIINSAYSMTPTQKVIAPYSRKRRY